MILYFPDIMHSLMYNIT